MPRKVIDKELERARLDDLIDGLFELDKQNPWFSQTIDPPDEDDDESEFDVESLNDYRLEVLVLSLAAGGEPCVPDDPRPACKAWEKRRRAKEGPASNTYARQRREERAVAKAKAVVPPRSPSAQRRFEEWQQARAAAGKPAAPVPFVEPHPGEAGYGEVVHIDKVAVDASLDTPQDVTVQTAKELGGSHVNKAYIVTTTDGTKGLFKPLKGERYRMFGGLIRDGVDPSKSDATMAEREVLASRLDQALGLDVTPSTVMVKMKASGGLTASHAGLGSLQGWVENDSADQKQANIYKTKENIQRAARMGILDAVMANLDRHPENFLIGKDGKLWAVDHGLAFGDSPMATGVGGRYVRESRSWALGNIRAGDLDAAEQKAIATKIDSMKWDALLSGSKLNQAERDSLRDRATQISDYLHRGEAHLIATKLIQPMNEIYRKP